MMFDPLYYFEKAAKAVRGGILAASDNLAFLVSDACRTPDSAAGSPRIPLRLLRPPRSRAATAPREIAPFPRCPRGAPNLVAASSVALVLNSVTAHGSTSTPVQSQTAGSTAGLTASGICRTATVAGWTVAPMTWTRAISSPS
jgi:hypothetical protein